MIFDDLVYDNDCTWTQLCEECSQNYKDFGYLSDIATYLICGVKDCQREAKYYLDLHKTFS